MGDRKLCGILIENRLQGNVIVDCIIGIGLNVNQRVFLSDAPNPVSMYQLTGQELDRDELLKAFIENLDQEWQSKANGSEYRELLYRKGKDGLYEAKTGRFVARLADVLPDGRLLLVDEEGKEHTYAFKEVSFIIDN